METAQYIKQYIYLFAQKVPFSSACMLFLLLYGTLLFEKVKNNHDQEKDILFIWQNDFHPTTVGLRAAYEL